MKSMHDSVVLFDAMIKHVANDFKSVSFAVRSEPRTKGSKKMMPLGKRKFVRDQFGNPHELARRHVLIEESSKQLKYWMQQIKLGAQSAMSHQPIESIDQPVAVVLQFLLNRPKGHYGTGRNAGSLKKSAPKHQAVKPDVDKLSRAVLDAIEGICFSNDSRVKTLIADKEYVTTETGVNGLMATIVYLDELKENPARK